MTRRTPIDASRDRLARLQQTLCRHNFAAYLATGPVEVSYLSNFGGDDSWLFVPARGKPFLLTDFRFAEDAAADCPHLAARLRKGSLAAEVTPLAARLRRPVAFNPDDLTVSQRRLLGRSVGAGGLKPLPDAVRRMRLIKDANEVDALRCALRIAEAAYADFLKRIRIGMTERELAAELDYCMHRRGADGPGFPTICAVGPNASRPHHRPGKRRLERTSPLLVDFGAFLGGYTCDLTRMVFLTRIRPRVRRAYQAVLEAQLAAIAVAGPGVRAVDVDAAARTVLARHALAEAFGHGTGHGLGRQVHEAPTLSPRSGRVVLEPGMVVTVEPGVYLPGRFGIRIEDDVLITATGAEVLSRLPKSADEVTLDDIR